MTYRSGFIARILAEAAATEEKYRGEGSGDPACTPWMPFNLYDFVALLAEALPEALSDEAAGHQFLDIGCGPGSKLLVARDVFGLSVTGFDIADQLVTAARERGFDVRACDAASWDYSGYGIVMFNRTYKDNARQAALEQRVWDQADPGTVVICAHLDAPPPGWIPVVDDWDARRGAWKKP